MTNPKTDIIRNADVSIYHLHLQPEELADHVFLVGDPGRVELVAQRFDRVEVSRQNREFCTVTGWKDGQRLSVLSTGIGSDNIDIVCQEMDLLVNYDWEQQVYRDDLRSLKILRLGTCGGLQSHIDVGTLIHSRYAIGSDSMMAFYQPEQLPASIQVLNQSLRTLTTTLNAASPLSWYGSLCDERLDEIISTQFPEIQPGITFTATGFYGPQGRHLGRIPPTMPDLLPTLSQFQFDGLPIVNMEMEASAVMGLGRMLGHQAGTLSVVIAHRTKGIMHPSPPQAVDMLIETGLRLMLAWAAT